MEFMTAFLELLHKLTPELRISEVIGHTQRTIVRCRSCRLVKRQRDDLCNLWLIPLPDGDNLNLATCINIIMLAPK